MATGRFTCRHVLMVPVLALVSLVSETKAWSHTGPRLKLSHSDLRNSSAMFWEGGLSGGHQVLLLDEDEGWLLVGGRDKIYLLTPERLDSPARTIFWPAAEEHVKNCVQTGKSLQTECSNFVRLLQMFNSTHVYACGTGAFNPQCVLLHVNAQELSMISHTVESGRGKCPFSPTEAFTALLTDGELYAGTSIDFMGANAAIFRTTISSQHYIRTEVSDRNWLNEPHFVSSVSIPDTQSPDDDKVYVFFRERALDAPQWDTRVYSRVARVCKNDVGGRRSLINRWTTFLKARLLCSVTEPSGVDTHFDELEDIFVLETKDPQNPMIYGVFTTSSSIFRGSAVCAFSMSSIRAAFNGPFAHRETSDHRWHEFKGRVPYPRPGACPSETYDVLHKSTKDFPDEVVSFIRQHQLMWEPVLPLSGRPVLTRINVSYMLKKVVVDRVDTEDGTYDVLHLGTDDGKVLKTLCRLQDNGHAEDVVLEELDVFLSPIVSMKLSVKRQQLYVSSEDGMAQLPLHRCDSYSEDCAACSRDPYCSWDGQSCSTYFTTNKRRMRGQDIKDGPPWSQCPLTDDVFDSVELRSVYAVEGNATFLECVSHLSQAELRWTVELPDGETRQSRTISPDSDEDHQVLMERGLLLLHLKQADSGVYTCTGHQHSFSRVLAQYRVHVIPKLSLHPDGHLNSLCPDRPRRTGPAVAGDAGFLGLRAPDPPAVGHRHSWLKTQQSLKTYKNLHLTGTNKNQDLVGTDGLSVVQQYCEQLRYREKRCQQKLRMLKLKHENKKSRVRRHNPPDTWSHLENTSMKENSPV